MKIIGKRDRIDDDFKYKIGDYVYHNGDRCCIIGYHMNPWTGACYCIEVPSEGHTGAGSVNEYGDPIDLSKFNCWFVSEEYYQK